MAETLPTLTWTSPAAEQLDRQEFTATRGESIVQPFSRSSSSTKDISGHTVTVRFAATNRSQTSLKVTATVSSASEFSVALTDTHLTTLPARTWYWQAFDETDKELLSYGTFVLFENFDLADDGTIPLASLYVPTSRTISINGTSYDLSENRSWTISASSAWADITGKPTTLSGYGITDAASDAELANYLPLAGGTMTSSTSHINMNGSYIQAAGIVQLRNTDGFVTNLQNLATATRNLALPDSSGTLYNTGGTDVLVSDGGTGRSSHTAYALIAGGITSTIAQQSLSVGATTEILVGGGASALPVWTTATGSGAPVRATSPTLTTAIISGVTTIRRTGGNSSNDVLIDNDGTNTTIQAKQGRIDFLDSSGFSRAAIDPNTLLGGLICRNLLFRDQPTVSATTIFLYADAGLIRTKSTGSFSWTASGEAYEAGQDTALDRYSAGVVRVTNGSTGDGQIMAGGTVLARLSVAPSSPPSGYVVFYALDADGGAKLYSKDSSGTVRSVTLS